MLNQSYEPIKLTNVKKALTLLCLDKVELIADDDEKKVHSSSRAHPWPSVIRLKNYRTVPHKRIIISRKNILRRDGNQCAYCGVKNTELTLDHIIPKSRGGDDTWENLVTSCVKCNNKKGNNTPVEAGMPLLVKPYRPDHLMLIKSEVGQVDEKWKPFLFV